MLKVIFANLLKIILTLTFGHMKDEIDLSKCFTHQQLCDIICDWIDYYNNDRYQWDLAKLSPNEFFRYMSTGIYPEPYPEKLYHRCM